MSRDQELQAVTHTARLLHRDLLFLRDAGAPLERVLASFYVPTASGHVLGCHEAEPGGVDTDETLRFALDQLLAAPCTCWRAALRQCCPAMEPALGFAYLLQVPEDLDVLGRRMLEWVQMRRTLALLPEPETAPERLLVAWCADQLKAWPLVVPVGLVDLARRSASRSWRLEQFAEQARLQQLSILSTNRVLADLEMLYCERQVSERQVSERQVSERQAGEQSGKADPSSSILAGLEPEMQTWLLELHRAEQVAWRKDVWVALTYPDPLPRIILDAVPALGMLSCFGLVPVPGRTVFGLVPEPVQVAASRHLPDLTVCADARPADPLDLAMAATELARSGLSPLEAFAAARLLAA